MPDLNILVVTPSESIEKIEFEKSGTSKLRILITLAQNRQEGTLDFTFTPAPSLPGAKFRLEGDPYKLSVELAARINPEVV